MFMIMYMFDIIMFSFVVNGDKQKERKVEV